jgi:hypothetical protein
VRPSPVNPLPTRAIWTDRPSGAHRPARPCHRCATCWGPQSVWNGAIGVTAWTEAASPVQRRRRRRRASFLLRPSHTCVLFLPSASCGLLQASRGRPDRGERMGPRVSRRCAAGAGVVFARGAQYIVICLMLGPAYGCAPPPLNPTCVPTGPTGPTGLQGPVGPAGPAGANGSTGATGEVLLFRR